VLPLCCHSISAAAAAICNRLSYHMCRQVGYSQQLTRTMIIYSKTLWGLPLLSRVYGSALPRALAPALLSGLVTLVLLLAASSSAINQLWAHPFAYQPFAFIVSFVLAFR